MALITILASSIYYARISKTFHRKLQTEKVTEDLLVFAKFVFMSHYNYQVDNHHLTKMELEKALAPHSRVLAWRAPGTGKPGGLPSMPSHRLGHD